MEHSQDSVRVGIIRCDTHGFWYAHLFERPDPAVMRQMHRGCHYYFHEPGDPTRLRIPPIDGMRITKVYDEDDRAEAEKLSAAFGGRPEVCDSHEDVSDDVDLVYVADCNFEGKDHLRYAAPGLAKGVPHFVDKPFAFTLADARAMIALAREHHTAVMCASLLGYAPHLERFKTRLADVAPLTRVIIPGVGPSLAGVFHAVSAAQCIMGPGCEWVRSMGPELYDVLHLHYPGEGGGTEVIIFNSPMRIPDPPHFSSTYHHCEVFRISAYGAGHAAHAPAIGDYEYPFAGARIVGMAKEMAQTGQPPVDYPAMLELMEIIEAARAAHNTGERVALQTLR